MKTPKVFANETIYLKDCKRFTRVSNHITLNGNLSVTEIGLITKLLSNDPSYIINKETEQVKSGLGIKAFRNSWAILEQEGYVVSKKTRSNTGYRYEYIISSLPVGDDIQALLSNQHVSTDTEQAVEKNRLERTASKVLLNKDVKNEELKNIELKNKNKNTLEITNTGKLVKTVEGNIVADINISEFIEYFEDNSISNVITSTVSEGNEIKVDDNINSSVIPEGINYAPHNDNHIGTLNNTSTALEPALMQVQPEKKERVFSSIQEEVKHKVRVYVIKNKILPEVVKEELESMYSWDIFVQNTQNLDTEGLFQYIVKLSGIIPIERQNTALKVAM